MYMYKYKNTYIYIFLDLYLVCVRASVYLTTRHRANWTMSRGYICN